MSKCSNVKGKGDFFVTTHSTERIDRTSPPPNLLMRRMEKSISLSFYGP
jgi:hypothetical protein